MQNFASFGRDDQARRYSPGDSASKQPSLQFTSLKWSSYSPVGRFSCFSSKCVWQGKTKVPDAAIRVRIEVARPDNLEARLAIEWMQYHRSFLSILKNFRMTVSKLERETDSGYDVELTNKPATRETTRIRCLGTTGRVIRQLALARVDNRSGRVRNGRTDAMNVGRNESNRRLENSSA